MAMYASAPPPFPQPSYPDANVWEPEREVESGYVNVDPQYVPRNGYRTGTGAAFGSDPADHGTEASAPSTTSKAKTSAQSPMPEESEVVIAVMGATGSGKTTFINTASGSTLRIGKGLRSCTNVVQIAESFYLDGRKVVLIDTPGFDDTTKSDTDILRMIAAFLTTTYEQGIKLAGVLYIHRISDFRMGGISTRNFKMFRQLCGESTLKNVVILTNMWGQVNPEVGEARERELATDPLFFKPVLDKGAQMLRHDNTPESAQRVLRYIIGNHPLTLQIQRELVDEGKDILQTAAGEELNRELLAQLKKHEADMADLQREMQEAMREKDEETRREIEAEQMKLRAEMNRVRNDAEKLASNYQEEKERLEEQMREMMRESQRAQEETAARYQEQIDALEARLRDSAAASLAERQAIQKELDELRRRPPPSRGGFFGMIGAALDRIFGIHR
ncbi:TKL/TKL-ccin protein kinase [Coprinopsis cinerea AmutBmut pab1-1]|nr:TKL/TKL-ccin protein kinase [Coprinopsis cinerea AmutBmut pab1-1]